jgi:enoyl-CoA hydratase/carnithine racemase
MSASVLLRELVSIDVAKELTMTAREISGAQAKALGLVSYVGDDYVEKAEALAAEISARSPDAVCGAKRLFNTTWTASDAEALRVETDIQRKILTLQNTLVAGSQGLKLPLPLSFKDRQPDWEGSPESNAK